MAWFSLFYVEIIQHVHYYEPVVVSDWTRACFRPPSCLVQLEAPTERRPLCLTEHHKTSIRRRGRRAAFAFLRKYGLRLAFFFTLNQNCDRQRRGGGVSVAKTSLLPVSDDFFPEVTSVRWTTPSKQLETNSAVLLSKQLLCRRRAQRLSDCLETTCVVWRREKTSHLRF